METSQSDSTATISPSNTPSESEFTLSEVDLGTKDKEDFDEMIVFTHTFLNYRKCFCAQTLEEFQTSQFKLLPINEFILKGNLLFETNSKPSNSEVLKTVKLRAKSFNDNDISAKKGFIDNIPTFIEEIGLEQTVDLILPIILKIHNEKDAVIETFLSVFPDFVKTFSKFEDKGYDILRDNILTVLREIFDTTNSDKIIELCSEALVCITRYIKQDDKANVLTIVIIKANDDENEQNRVLAVKLFNDLAAIIGQEFCELYVVPQMQSFADDQSCKVRKTLASNFINICNAVSKQCFNTRLLDIYKKLSNDSLWTVRKQAVESLPKLTKLCDKKTINTILIDLYKKFSTDNKNYVRLAANEIFGEFVSLLDKEDILQHTSLLEFYINTIKEFTSGDNKSKKEEHNVLAKCAYNFPAVLLYYGKESWEKLKPCYLSLCAETNEQIRLSLSSSIGEVSKILGSEITESELLPLVETFFNNNEKKDNKNVQIKILGVLPDIIRNIKSNSKNKFLDYLKIMLTKTHSTSNSKWRLRLAYCEIAGKYHNTFSDELTYKRIFPIAISFCFDDIDEVRRKSAESNSKMLLQLLTSKATNYKVKTYNIFKSFAQSVNYFYRQLFLLMCVDLLENQELYHECIEELIFDLAFDKVLNVRLALGVFLSKMINKYTWLRTDETVRKIITVLKQDKVNDVKRTVEGIDIEECKCEIKENINAKFVDRMTLVNSEFGITANVPLKVNIRDSISQK